MNDVFNERMAVCVHEAGHAVLALRLGGTASVRLKISPDGMSGQTTERPNPSITAAAAYFRASLVAAAGEIAEYKFFRRAPPPWCVQGDHDRLARYAETLGQDHAAMVRDVHRRVVRAFNNERIWQGVLALAGYFFARWPNDGTTEIDDATLRAVVPWVAS